MNVSRTQSGVSDYGGKGNANGNQFQINVVGTRSDESSFGATGVRVESQDTWTSDEDCIKRLQSNAAAGKSDSELQADLSGSEASPNN